jgi:hypothetical protein
MGLPIAHPRRFKAIFPLSPHIPLSFRNLSVMPPKKVLSSSLRFSLWQNISVDYGYNAIRENKSQGSLKIFLKKACNFLFLCYSSYRTNVVCNLF